MSGVLCASLLALGDDICGCIGDGDMSYGIGSAKDMYMGLLAMVLYGVAFG